MRTLLERAREAQATRIAHDPSADVRQLAMADIDAAIRISGYREIVPEKISDTLDRKSTRLNSSHSQISYAVFCLKKKTKQHRSRNGQCAVQLVDGSLAG